jgi:hypothetical protein
VPRALESGQLSGHCGLRIWLNGERPVAIDPQQTSAHREMARPGHRKFDNPDAVWQPSRWLSEVTLRAGGPILPPVENKVGGAYAHERY